VDLSPLDGAVIFAYIIFIYGIALKANFFMHKLVKRKNEASVPAEEGNTPIANHYLAGGSITFKEALFSIIATEFSALAFFTIPTYAYFENLTYMRFVVGV
jgi:Na+/proline symporter